MTDTSRLHHKSGHVLPRDVFKTLVRLETRLDWHVSENEVADQLNLPHTYVDPVVPLASQFVGPGPGHYEPANSSSMGSQVNSISSLPLSSFSTCTRRQLLFEPQYVKPHETFREGPFSQSTPALPRPTPLPLPQKAYPRTYSPPKPTAPRRRNALRSPIAPLVQLPSPPKPMIDASVISYTFPRGPRTDVVAYNTPPGVSAVSYDPQPVWAEEIEPPRVVVGFRSSVARVPSWMANADVLAPADQYRKCVVVERRKLSGVPPNGTGDKQFELDGGHGPDERRRSPSTHFDPFEWLRSQPDGPEKVQALTMRLADLTDSCPPTNQLHHVDGTAASAVDEDGEKAASGEDCVANPISITVVLPAGLTFTYRVLATRTVASLKQAIAKKLTTKRTRETRHVPDGVVVPAMLTLYLQGKKLVDSSDLGDSGVRDRSSLVCAIHPRSTTPATSMSRTASSNNVVATTNGGQTT